MECLLEFDTPSNDPSHHGWIGGDKLNFADIKRNFAEIKPNFTVSVWRIELFPCSTATSLDEKFEFFEVLRLS